MYCARCGVELQKGAAACPLCGLRAYHPDITEQPEAPPYPRGELETVSHGGLLFIANFLLAVVLVACLIVDLSLNASITWGGVAIAGLITGYIAVCLPLWFKRPNPVILFPIAAAAGICLSLFLCIRFGGHWFMPFAFPVGGAALLIVEAVIVLTRHAVGTRKYRMLYIFGGAAIAVGGLCVLIEFLLKIAFGLKMTWWSLYPLAVLFLFGMLLIIAGICRPLRRFLHKKLFI